MSQTPSHILENLQTALPAVAKAVKGGWDNIQNFAIKTNSSVSLPIWSYILNVTDSRQTEDAEKGGEDLEKEEEDEDEDEEKVAKEHASRKGRKRVTSSDEEMERVEKPRKRSKAADGMVRSVSISKKIEREEEEEEKAAKEQPSRKRTKSITNSGEEIEEVEKPRKAAGGMTRGVSISKKEVRQKRSADIGEKKKRIVLMSKGSKSAMLGKKVRTSRIHP